MEHDDSERAMFLLGTMYKDGVGVQASYPTALRWFERALAAGYLLAAHYIGVFFEDGKAVAKDKTKAHGYFVDSYHAILEHIRDHDDWHAHFMLGSRYEFGIVPCAVDMERAAREYKIAAEANHALAQNNLYVSLPPSLVSDAATPRWQALLSLFDTRAHWEWERCTLMLDPVRESVGPRTMNESKSTSKP